jgi:NADPH2:quinone reductase
VDVAVRPPEGGGRIHRPAAGRGQAGRPDIRERAGGDGRAPPVIGASYPLARIADAHRRVEAGHKRGNIVVMMTDDSA